MVDVTNEPISSDSKSNSIRRRTIIGLLISILIAMTIIGYTNWILPRHLQAIPPHVSGGTITTRGQELPPCNNELNFTLSLETLKETANAGCDFATWTIVLSDSVTLEVPEYSAIEVIEQCPSKEAWGITNLGDGLGVVAYTPTKIWGDKHAVSLVQKAGWQKSLGKNVCQTKD